MAYMNKHMKKNGDVTGDGGVSRTVTGDGGVSRTVTGNGGVSRTPAATDTAPSQSIGRSAALMSVLVVISRITGFFRTWAQAYAMGATLLASCYTVANNLPNQLYELVIGGMIVTAFLPVYLSVKQRAGREGANAYVSNLLSIVFVLMGVLTVLCIAFAAQLVWIQSAGTDQAQMADAVYLFRFFAVEVLLYCLSSIASGVLNAERDYLWSNAAPIFNNFITIASFLAYPPLAAVNPGLGMLVLALGNPLGVLVQVLMQVPSLRRHGVRITWHIDLHDPAIKETDQGDPLHRHPDPARDGLLLCHGLGHEHVRPGRGAGRGQLGAVLRPPVVHAAVLRALDPHHHGDVHGARGPMGARRYRRIP